MSGNHDFFEIFETPAIEPDNREPKSKIPTLVIGSLDTADGLARISGNLDLYLEILSTFCQEYSHFRKDLEDKQGQDGRAEKIRLFHSLKGFSGSIGARELFDTSTELERLLRREQDLCDDTFSSEKKAALEQTLLQQLETVLGDIRDFLKINSDLEARDNSFSEDSIPRFYDKLSQLERAVREFDAAALDLAKEAAGLTGDPQARAILEKTRHCLINFDYGAALKQISELSR